jgi:renalase
MCCRYEGNYQFDFGTQFFTAKTEVFQEFLQPFEELGIIKKWHAHFVEIDQNKVVYGKDWDDDYPHYVAIPKMNQLCKEISSSLDIKLKTTVSEIVHKNNSVELLDEEKNSLGVFDWVVSSVPSQQFTELAPESFTFSGEVKNKKMVGCFSLMLAFDSPLTIEWHVAVVKNSKISFITLDYAKPNRPKTYCVTALARNSWAEANIERDQEEIKNELISELKMVTKNHLPKIIYSDIHRFRYTNIKKQYTGNTIKTKCFIDPETKIAVCGDWIIQGRVEAAFLSGKAAAEEIRKFIL